VNLQEKLSGVMVWDLLGDSDRNLVVALSNCDG
jgi:GH18 family chitinase